MKAYKILILATLAMGSLLSCQDEEDWKPSSPQAEELIKPSFRLFVHGLTNSINADTDREDRVEEVFMVGAAAQQNTAAGVTTYQVASYKGKKDLFFAANVPAVPTYQEFNQKRFDATPYVKLRGEAQLKLPMVATLRDVECKTTPDGKALFQGATPIGNATPVELKRVFAKVDFKLLGLKDILEENPDSKVELMNVPKHFTLASPINNYDLLSDAGRYLPPFDLTQACKDHDGDFSVYLPEHYVSAPEFGTPDDEGMTYLRISIVGQAALQTRGVTSSTTIQPFTLSIRIGTPDAKQPDFGQITRNKVYTLTYDFKSREYNLPPFSSGFAN